MKQFEIAELILGIDCSNREITDRLLDFACNKDKVSDLHIGVKALEHIDEPEGTILAKDIMTWMLKPIGQDGYYISAALDPYIEPICLLDVNESWNKATIYCLDAEDEIDPNLFNYTVMINSYLMIGVVFRYALLQHEGIVIHASAIEYKGKGIIFSAPSGTGKSTHVALWRERFGDQVRVLNDDTPALRFKDNKPYVYGTPWSGSSRIHTNTSAPLEAIVILQQAPTNSIEQISLSQAVTQLMPRAFLPYFNQNIMNLACDSFERIIASVPVYVLKCKPDQEAVELVYNCVM